MAVVLLVKEVLGVLEAVAPLDRLGEGVLLVQALALALGVGVTGGVAVAEPVGVGVGVPLGVPDALLLPESERLGVAEPLAPGLRDAVGEALTVELPLRVDEAVPEAVPVPDAVGVPVGVWLDDVEAVVLLV